MFPLAGVYDQPYDKFFPLQLLLKASDVLRDNTKMILNYTTTHSPEGFPNSNNAIQEVLKQVIESWQASHHDVITTIYNQLCLQFIDLGIEYKISNDHLSTYIESLFCSH